MAENTKKIAEIKPEIMIVNRVGEVHASFWPPVSTMKQAEKIVRQRKRAPMKSTRLSFSHFDCSSLASLLGSCSLHCTRRMAVRTGGTWTRKALPLDQYPSHTIHLLFIDPVEARHLPSPAQSLRKQPSNKASAAPSCRLENVYIAPPNAIPTSVSRLLDFWKLS